MGYKLIEISHITPASALQHYLCNLGNITKIKPVDPKSVIYGTMSVLLDNGELTFDMIEELTLTKMYTNNYCNSCETYSRDDMVYINTEHEYGVVLCKSCINTVASLGERL